MFVIASEACEKPEKKEVLLPEMLVAHYPEDTILVHWLYCYQATWELTGRLPFMDQRVVSLVHPTRRAAFILFTNLYYVVWMKEHEEKKPRWFDEHGYTETCYKCAKQSNCKEYCHEAMTRVKVNHSKYLRRRVQEFEAQMEVRVSDADLDALVRTSKRRPTALALGVLFSGICRPVPVPPKALKLEGVSQDQKEWWVV